MEIIEFARRHLDYVCNTNAMGSEKQSVGVDVQIVLQENRCNAAILCTMYIDEDSLFQYFVHVNEMHMAMRYNDKWYNAHA